MKKFALLSVLFLGFCQGSFGKSFKGSSREDCNYPTIFDPATNLATLNLRIPNKQGREGEFQCPNTNTDFFPADPFCSEFYYTCVNGIAYPQECPGTSGITAFDPVTKTCRPLECCGCYFTCPASDPNGFFPVPGACSSGYYVCVDGLYETYTNPLAVRQRMVFSRTQMRAVAFITIVQTDRTLYSTALQALFLIRQFPAVLQPLMLLVHAITVFLVIHRPTSSDALKDSVSSALALSRNCRNKKIFKNNCECRTADGIKEKVFKTGTHGYITGKSRT
ncbi:hypothetical protein GHT06_008095 [Daphnia sinensis]|uniref:Chitin-binding type-2 domain-containing protein n=1 Tax=Daphnia sinensis TaxID=1820382 RepID=A0AAD5L1G7_9CRUS|nr:hypothetical protein GHT06_008095 [Daphnia sinensis]